MPRAIRSSADAIFAPTGQALRARAKMWELRPRDELDNPENSLLLAKSRFGSVGQASSLEVLDHGTPSGLTSKINMLIVLIKKPEPERLILVCTQYARHRVVVMKGRGTVSGSSASSRAIPSFWLSEHQGSLVIDPP